MTKPGLHPPDPPRGSSDASSRQLEVGVRERGFWDKHVPNLADCVSAFERGPDPNTRVMLDAVEPLRGRRVLDFACGAGITSAFLAQRGAVVTGIDISPASIRRARELAERTELPIDLVVGELAPSTFPAESFDSIVGRYALHHVDLSSTAPIFSQILAPGGSGAFVETMGLNPLLNFARKRLAGRGAVASYGSDDERPLERVDLDLLNANVGPVELTVGEMRMFRIFDRNVLRYRRPRLSAAIGATDDVLLRLGLGLWSYHQVVKVSKRA